MWMTAETNRRVAYVIRANRGAAHTGPDALNVARAFQPGVMFRDKNIG